MELRYAVYSCAVKLGRMSILTVAVVLTTSLVLVQLRYAVYICAVKLGRVPIWTVSVLLTSSAVTLEVC